MIKFNSSILSIRTFLDLSVFVIETKGKLLSWVNYSISIFSQTCLVSAHIKSFVIKKNLKLSNWQYYRRQHKDDICQGRINKILDKFKLNLNKMSTYLILFIVIIIYRLCASNRRILTEVITLYIIKNDEISFYLSMPSKHPNLKLVLRVGWTNLQKFDPF